MFFEDTKLTETVFVSPGETIASVEVGVHVIMAGLAGRDAGDSGVGAEDDDGQGETLARSTTAETSARRTAPAIRTVRLRVGSFILSF
jgi:hypothetical protein